LGLITFILASSIYISQQVFIFYEEMSHGPISFSNVDAGMGGFPSESTNCVKAKWTSAMDRFFLELMLVEVKKGSINNNTFSKEAWKDMLTLFNAKFCSQYGKNVLKRRYKKLFKYYCEMRSLLERKVFQGIYC
jgi:hypothetical protein